MRVAFLASGGGGTLRFVYHFAQLHGEIEVCRVIADRDCGAIEFARENEIQSSVVHYSRERPEEIREEIAKIPEDAIIVTNFNKIIDSATVELFTGRLVNLHYSILPSFSGLIGMKTVGEAKSRGNTIIGSTCHYVDEIVDNGPIISQSALCVNWEDEMEAAVKDRLFRSSCLNLVNALFHINGKSGVSLTREFQGSFFSPELLFSTEGVTEKIWQQVKG